MACLNATADIDIEDIRVEASLMRDKINVSLTCVCDIGDNNALLASDGTLYTADPEPLFTTEK